MKSIVKYFICFNICLILILSFTCLSVAKQTAYVWSNNSSSIQTASTPDDNNSLSLESASAILIEQSTRANSIFP